VEIISHSRWSCSTRSFWVVDEHLSADWTQPMFTRDQPRDNAIFVIQMLAMFVRRENTFVAQIFQTNAA
jgi:hypothetical protein